MKSLFKPGLYTALVTPFIADSTTLDIQSFTTLLHMQKESQVAGIVLFGTTGESPTVTNEERSIILKHAMKEVGSSMTVMAGISTNNFQTALTLATQAKQIGVHGLQIATPAYNRPSQEGIYQFYKALGESVDIPIFAYNIPTRSAIHIEKKTMQRLFSLPHIRGIKEASGSLTTLFDVLHAAKSHHGDFLILEGDDMLAIPALASGAHGIMSVVSNLIPQTMKHLLDCLLTQNFDEARAIFFHIRPLIEACFIETNPTPIKQLLHMRGIIQTPAVRLPLVEPEPHSKEQLQTIEASFKKLT